jgi:hypothetical protein
VVDFAPPFDDTEPYEEFALVAENAAEMGVAWPGRHLPRRTRCTLESGQSLSVIQWGTTEPEFVFLHGGGQNAHTWDRLSWRWTVRPWRSICLAMDTPTGVATATTARGRTRSLSPR